MTVRTIQNPSVVIYDSLQILHSNTLRCPCSTMIIPYHEFISLSPTFHEVCSSDLISDRWISILKESITYTAPTDWRNKAYQQFQLLSNLCKFANRTVRNTIDQFSSNYFISSNAMNEIDFNSQINVVLIQLFNSTIIYFDQIIDIINSLIDIDQPYAGSVVEGSLAFAPNIIQDTSSSSRYSVVV